MDASLRRLEQLAAESPRDRDLAGDLARAYLRAGRLTSAHRVARVAGGAIHEEAAARVGEALGWTLRGVAPRESWRDEAGSTWVLVPAGAYLEEGPHAFSSSLELGSSRAPLRRVSIEDFLITLLPAPAPSRADFLAALAPGERLPTAQEWKKSWRGGLYLDGDLLAREPNPEPDRLQPTEVLPGGTFVRAPTGLLFLHEPQDERERCEDSAEWLCAIADDGRYRVPARSAAEPLARRVRRFDPAR